jgi:hypothetical protein
VSSLPPPFFEPVRAEAAALWRQLEDNEALAGPWRQLFRQIKSPRHVLSELLQNADDAGARWARAWSADGVFYFEHDGVDFAPEHLQSLCRFGLSNKRHLHTIGFRGLGFKSLFSYGPVVELTTPSLAIRFEETRFTEPVWVHGAPRLEHTRIAVRFRDAEVATQAMADMARWANSPVPLLFFRSLTELEIGEACVRKRSLGPGPAGDSEWFELVGAGVQKLLVVRSPEEPPPPDALNDVRGERMDPGFSIDAISLQLVFGLGGTDRLYVVLPTEVEWAVPFSCNAPFLQDPARTGIKHPAESPLNRWLLRRLGALAGETLAVWLSHDRLALEERARAYELLPAPDVQGDSLGATAAAYVLDSMREVLDGAPVLLARTGEVAGAGTALDLPPEVADVWSEDIALRVWGSGESHLLAEVVPAKTREMLASWGFLARRSRAYLVSQLHKSPEPIPRPRPEALERLWAFVEAGVRANRWAPWVKELRLVPVEGSDELRRPQDVLVAGEVTGSFREDDWSFLARFFALADREWLRRIGEEEDDHEEAPASAVTRRRQAARDLLDPFGLEEEIETETVIERAAAFLGDDPEGRVRLAHVAARARIAVPHTFPVQTADGEWREIGDDLLALDEPARSLLPEAWLLPRTLHARYEEGLANADREAWRGWLRGRNGNLLRFAVPDRTTRRLWSRKDVERIYRERGGRSGLEYPYVRDNFVFTDYDFPAVLWDHWGKLARNDSANWPNLLTALAAGWSDVSRKATANLQQEGNRYAQSMHKDRLAAAWIQKLRAIACVPDEYGTLQEPAVLLRAMPDTAFLKGVEPFVHPDFDRSELHPVLDALGVRSSPSNAEALLNRLRALAKAPSAPAEAVLRVYGALDLMVGRLPADQAAPVRAAFHAETLIRSEEGGWHRAEELYQENPDRLPGVALLWRRAAHLGLWRQVGVPERPSVDMLLDWLRRQPRGERLDAVLRERVRALLGGLAERVWTSCRAWLDLEGRWAEERELRWRSGRVAHTLFPHVRQRTADVSMLPADLHAGELFPGLPPLEEALELRIHCPFATDVVRPEWVDALANAVLRVPAEQLAEVPERASRDGVHADHAAAWRLAGSRWREAGALQLTPYLDGTPAGPPQSVAAAWMDDALVVVGRPAQHHRELVDAIRGAFATPAVCDAVTACVGRDPEWIEEYFSEVFELMPAAASGPPLDPRAPDPGAPTSAAPRPAPPAPIVVTAPRIFTPPPVPVRPHMRSEAGWRSLIERALRTLGYEPNGGGRFEHPDGGWAALEANGIVHATTFTPGGEVESYFWATDDTLDEGVEVPADVWKFMERFGNCSRVVLPERSEVVIYPLSRLTEVVEVFPATYRLRRCSR